MSSKLAKVEPAPLAAGGFTREHVELIKKTLASEKLSDLELELFLHQANRSGLDPLARQIYAVKRSGKLVIQTGIDGYRAIADRTGQYAGSDDPQFDEWDNKGNPGIARVTVYKLVSGQRCAFTASARWSEYKPDSDFMWRKMPHTMLGKVAEALALRKAFPLDLSGLYTDTEMEQAGSMEVAVEAERVAEAHHVTAPVGTREAANQVAQDKILKQLEQTKGLIDPEKDPVGYARAKQAYDTKRREFDVATAFGPKPDTTESDLKASVAIQNRIEAIVEQLAHIPREGMRGQELRDEYAKLKKLPPSKVDEALDKDIAKVARDDYQKAQGLITLKQQRALHTIWTKRQWRDTEVWTILKAEWALPCDDNGKVSSASIRSADYEAIVARFDVERKPPQTGEPWDAVPF